MGTLYIVATPIGNLEDMTLRAITVLSNVDLICAEDTRVTRALLDQYNIKTEVVSYHQHSSLQKVEQILALLAAGKRVALVSDAGTPGINDPGGYLVQRAHEAVPDLRVVPIPGANAAISALSASGFPADRFVYLGFPPHKKGRQTFFRDLGKITESIVFYESKHRILKTFDTLRTVSAIGTRPLMVARELTKQFETLYRGTLDEVEMQVKGDKMLGEFVIVIGPKKGKRHVE